MARGEQDFDPDDFRTRKTPDYEMPSMRSVEMRTVLTPDPASYSGDTLAFSDAGETGPTMPAKPTLDRDHVINGKHHVERKLSEGGFGAVYEGYYEIGKNKLKVAIKVLLPQKQVDHASVVRFDEEVRALCSLRDPHICRVLDGGIDKLTDKPFLVMDFCEGGSLKTKLKEAPEGRVDPRQAMVWMEQAAKGMLAAESHVDEHGNPAPIHHRDIKPENLLLQDGRVVVADFGAARLSGETAGVTSELVPPLWTPAYGSPEQNIGIADHRSDIYALGTTFFHLLTGQITARRFKDANDRFRNPHDPSKIVPTVPKELGDLIRHMTEPAPSARPQSFQEVIDALAAMRERKVSKLPTLLAAGMLAVFGAFVALEATGVIDLIQEGVIQNDRTLRELRQADERIAEHVAALAPQPAVAWLLPLQDGVSEVRAQLETNQQVLAPLLSEFGEEAQPPLPASYDQRLTETVGQLLRRRSELALPVAVALEARFAGVEFGDLAEAADRRAEEFVRCAEPAFAQRARAVARRTRIATALLGRLPQWPQGEAAAASVLDHLSELEAALQQLDQLGAEPDVSGDPVLAAWLRERAADRSRQWASLLQEQLQRQIGATRQEIDAFETRVGAASAAQMVELEREHAALVQRCAAVVARQREVLGIARGHGLIGQLGDVATERINAPVGPANDLAVFRVMLTDERYRPEPTAERQPLQAAAQAVGAARTALAEALDAAPPDRVALADRQRELLRARDLFEQATRALDVFEAAAAALATTPVLELRAACARNAALRDLSDLERERAGLERRVNEVDSERKGRVRGIESRLRAGEAPLEQLRADLGEVKAAMGACREIELEQRCQQLSDIVDQCAGVASAAPSWDDGQLPTFVVQLPALAAHEVEAGDALAGAWWQVRRQAIADGWCASASTLWGARYVALKQRCAQAPSGSDREALLAELEQYRQLDAELRRLARGLGSVLAGAVPFREPVPTLAPSDGAPPVEVIYPEGWVDRSFLPPEGVQSRPLRIDDPVCQRIYDREFLAQAQDAGLRLWYFDKRRDRAEQLVYMVWCQSADGSEAALVDVHPVIFREMWRTEYWGNWTYPRDSFEERSAETMAYYMTRSDAEEFARRVGKRTGNTFSLAPHRLRDWPLAAPFRGLPEPEIRADVYPAVALPCADVSRGGLCYLRYGVREWTPSGIVGTSLRKVPPTNAALQPDSGLRLAIVLSRRSQ